MLRKKRGPSRRRKACDLCFTKKIKCDSCEPQCSNCKVYNALCERSASRRWTGNNLQVHPVRSPPSTSSYPDPGHPRNTSQFIDGHDSGATGRGARPGPVIADDDRPGLSSSHKTIDHTWRFDPAAPKLYNGPADEYLTLPKLDTLMPILDFYFKFVNIAVPLFDQSSIMSLVTRWYSTVPERSTASWGAITAIVGLTLESMPSSEYMKNYDHIEKSGWRDSCMRNVQSVVPELALRDEDLLGVQVLVALAMLFRSAFDLRPSAVFIGMAARLAHQMQLHCDNCASLFTDGEALERSNVFWATYMIDKEINFKAKVPSMLPDSQITVPVHRWSMELVSRTVLFSKDRTVHFDLFLHRVDLARIESQIYELLYSSHGIQLGLLERQTRVQQLQNSLDSWNSQIPPAFRIENAAQTVEINELSHITQVYHIYLSCLVAVNGVWSKDAAWRQQTGILAQAAVDDFVDSLFGKKVTPRLKFRNPPFSFAWEHCVDISRHAVRLLMHTPITQSLLWQCACSHFSAIIIILANILSNPIPVWTSQEDLDLVGIVLSFDDLHFEDLHLPQHESLRIIIRDLFASANRVVASDLNPSDIEFGNVFTLDLEGLDNVLE
ncbi:fungal-specific transcription factor domain-containing protein [Xylariaceae sp. FL1019]|nr:fungal-specific transcription factor domain-containing protein [Xylariaceae sp. FL1019]